MVKNRKIENSDSLVPVLTATVASLRNAVDLASRAAASLPVAIVKISKVDTVTNTIISECDQELSATSCRQKLWFTFFFDGTGNNLQVDAGLSKLSNIAKLFRSHKKTDVAHGIHSVYIPGIGTCFPEVGDPGGTATGAAFADGGRKRINYALAEFSKRLQRPLKLASIPGNSIEEINVAVFGFSRGAALARAFTSLLMEHQCSLEEGRWKLNNASCAIRFRFMGLFDTVASVGNPLSRNNTDYYNPALSDVRAMLDERLEDYEDTSPLKLAFVSGAAAGADPSPGGHNGHDTWGGRMEIHETVEEVQHYVAAHEIRNSFPLESISMFTKGEMKKPAHFYEVLFPGAHSDVGGGYAPGEGARSQSRVESLSLIPLRQMYQCAIRTGVPMLVEFENKNREDFEIDPALCESFNKYMQKIGSINSLGEGINRYMKFYLAWKFREIKESRKGQRFDIGLIEKFDRLYGEQRTVIEDEQKMLEQRIAQSELISRVNDGLNEESRASNPEYHRRKNHEDKMNAELERKRAEAAALPDMRQLQSLSKLYDEQLLADAGRISAAVRFESKRGRSHSNLRPHYKGLLEAYEAGISDGGALVNEMTVRFFQNYVHDSLAGFGKDATFPSDPRVVFIGGDEKMKYASTVNEEVIVKVRNTG